VLLPLGILASSGGAAAADYELITTTVLSSSQSSVTFSGLGTSAAAYKHLQIRAVPTYSTLGHKKMTFNGDTTEADYYRHYLYLATSEASQNSYYQYVWNSDDTAPAIIDILDFADTNKYKTSKTLYGGMQSAGIVALASHLWKSTSAITSITLGAGTGVFNTGSRFSIYGLKG